MERVRRGQGGTVAKNHFVAITNGSSIGPLSPRERAKARGVHASMS